MHVLPFDSCTDTRAHARRRQCQLPLSLFVLLPFVDNERDGDHLAILATRRPFFFAFSNQSPCNVAQSEADRFTLIAWLVNLSIFFHLADHYSCTAKC
jgi:hypothetical protein